MKSVKLSNISFFLFFWQDDTESSRYKRGTTINHHHSSSSDAAIPRTFSLSVLTLPMPNHSTPFSPKACGNVYEQPPAPPPPKKEAQRSVRKKVQTQCIERVKSYSTLYCTCVKQIIQVHFVHASFTVWRVATSSQSVFP